MKQLIFILGVTGSGKTTVAAELARKLGCDLIEADKFYDYVGVKYQIPNYSRLCNPSYWHLIPNIREEKVGWYKEKLENIHSNTLIIEGATPVYKKELEDISQGLGINVFEKGLFIHLEPKNWGEIYKKKHNATANPIMLADYARDVCYNLSGINVLRIKDIDYLSSPLIYQRDGFTDIKWEKLGMKDRDLTGKSVLDLGCNSGWFGGYSFNQGAKSYTGVDNQIKEIIYARHLFDGEFIHEDLNKFLDKAIKEERKFDICILASTLHYFNNKEEIIKKISKLCKEFVLEIPVSKEIEAKEYPKPGKDYMIPSVSLVDQWLDKYFTSHRIVGESIPPDGSFRLTFNSTN